jgi:hypothetical protein
MTMMLYISKRSPNIEISRESVAVMFDWEVIDVQNSNAALFLVSMRYLWFPNFVASLKTPYKQTQKQV